MKKYIAPEMRIEKFECCDILSVSNVDVKITATPASPTLDSDAGLKFPGFEQ